MIRLVKNILLSLAASARYCLCLSNPVAQEHQRPVVPSSIIVWGVVVGFILCAVFAGSWKQFGDIYFSEYRRLRLVPSAMVLLVAGVLGFKQLLGLAVTVDRIVLKDPVEAVESRQLLRTITMAGILAVVLLILLKFSALLAMPNTVRWWPNDWRRYFNWLYPGIHFRVLILFGLWSQLGLLIAAATGAQSGCIADQDRAFRRSARIGTLLWNLVLVTMLTSIYFSSVHNRATGLVLSLFLFVLLYLASMLISRRQGGHDVHSMFACAELGGSAVLVGYLAIAKYM